MTESRGQVLLTDDADGDWLVTLIDPFQKPKLYLTFPTRDKARAAKKAIEASNQVYEVTLERKEIS